MRQSINITVTAPVMRISCPVLFNWPVSSRPEGNAFITVNTVVGVKRGISESLLKTFIASSPVM